MKKLFVLLFLAILLSACSAQQRAADDFERKLEKRILEQGENDDIYFKENVAKIEGIKIEITNTKVIPVGNKGNKGDKPLFAIWYKVTNYTDKNIDPIAAWNSIYNAVQENGSNKIDKLKMGTLPDQKYLDSQVESIKKNGTVENAVSYELDNQITPLTLIARQGVNGEEIGSQEFKIKYW
ncbi:DUF5067 domain-containing protein [Aciduricibacillus chroicocephali]|uniref:DUF5067 domain-containing protein n=1 Tax=Aciduricibacillus chroicocephali TaxID=3054939 RepID=A0ABY9KXE7_9BACI|nr:DUF5067 domain-containing protein [Bacillaceae bacterium 44XB]